MPEAYFRSSSVLVPVSVRTSSAPLSSSTTLSSFPANSQGASKYVAWVDFNQLPLPNKPGANSVDRSSSPLLHLSAALPRASLTGASAAGRLRAAFAAAGRLTLLIHGPPWPVALLSSGDPYRAGVYLHAFASSWHP